MDSWSNAAKNRRRPATYGKASKRALLGIQSPASSNEFDDDPNAFASNPLGERARAESTNSLERSSLESTGHSSQGSTDFRKAIGHSQKPSLSQESEPDPFDIPSSDDDKPLIPTPKPAAKKRRVQTNKAGETGAKGIAADIVSSGVDALPPPKMRLEPKTQPKPAGSDRLPVAGKEIVKLGKPANIIGGRPVPSLSKVDGVLLKKVGTSGTASPKRPREDSSHVLPPYRTKSKQSSPQLRQASTEDAGDSLVFDIPSTPPRPASRSSHMLTPKSEGKTRIEAPPSSKYFSPSGLDFPALVISGSKSPVRAQHTAKPLPSSQALQPSVPPTSTRPSQSPQRRSKLKDRMFAKGAASTHTEDTDSESSSSADEKMDVDAKSPARGKPSVHFQDPGEADHNPEEQSSQPRLAPAAQIVSGGMKKTYAARTRTLRREETDDDLLYGLADTDDFEPASSGRRMDNYLDMVSSQQQSTQDEFDDFDAPDASGMKSIHELRQAGGSARATGEAETILDEVCSKRPSVRRSGLLDLINKLDDASFRQQLINSGKESKLIRLLKPDPDLLTDSLFCMALLHILSEARSSHLLTQFTTQNVLGFFDAMIPETNSVRVIARNRKMNVTKSTQEETEKLCGSLLQSSLWRYGRPMQITPRTLALQCLEYLVRNSREARISTPTLSPELVERLLGILIATIPSAGNTDLIVKNEVDIQLALSILESATVHVGTPGEAKTSDWSRKSLEEAATFVTSIKACDLENAGQVWTLSLRLSLNLFNSSTTGCKVFSRPSVVNAITNFIGATFDQISAPAAATESEKSEEERDLAIDNLVLSLGFLINLVEQGEKSRKLFLSRVGSEELSPMANLLRIYASKWQRAFEVISEEESKTSVPIGYLTVLLCFMCIDVPTRQQVAASLEGGTLKHLLVAVDEFIKYNRKVEEQIKPASGEEGGPTAPEPEDSKTMFIGRLQAVVDQLKVDEGFA